MKAFSRPCIDMCSVPGRVLHAAGTQINPVPPLPPESSEFSQGGKQVNTGFPW